MARPVPPGSSSRKPSPTHPLRKASLALLGVAVLLSAWLVYLSLLTGPLPGCDGNHCGAVLTSKWAKIFGVPVGLFGAAAYTVLALLGWKPFPPGAAQRGPRILAATLVVLIPLAGLWFGAVQLFLVKAFCPWCTATHLVATTAAVLMALAWRRDAAAPAAGSGSGSGSGSPKAPRPVPAPPVWGAALGAASAAFAVFLVAQALSPEPPKARVLRVSMSTNSPAPASASPGATGVVAQGTGSVPAAAAGSATAVPSTNATAAAGAPAGGRRVVLHEGQFSLDPRDLPVSGSPDAEHLVVMISDYTCPHCRTAMQTLREVREFFGTRLGLVMVPAHHGGDSQEIQRLMLSTWKADPGVWSAVAGDLYFNRLPAVAAKVRPVLEERLGAARLSAALAASASWIDQTLALGKQLQATNRVKTGSGSIPQFIIGKEIIVGAPADAAEFYDLFEQHLGLVRDRFPVLQLASGEIDLGKVFAGTSRTLAIPVVNAGQTPLELARASLPQGGRLVRGLSAPLAPGQTSTVEIAFAAPREPGSFDQFVTLFSNARPPSTPLRVKGTVWKPVRLDPPILDFGRLDPDAGSTQSVMRIEFDEDAVVESVRTQNPGFRVGLREVAPARKYELDVATTAELASGNQQATVLVSLKKPVPAGWPENLALGARAIVERSVSFLPQRLVLPPGPLPNERHQSVLVRCAGTGCADFKVTGATLEGGPSFVLPDVSPAPGTNQFVVKLTLPAGWSVPEPPADVRLIVTTTHARYSRLEVPVVVQGQP